MSIEEDNARYQRAAHAMQSGIAMEMNHDPKLIDPKDMRVGINSAHVSVEALATLLIAKGVFTLEEYYQANADAMEREVKRFEARLTEHFGGATEVHLA